MIRVVDRQVNELARIERAGVGEITRVTGRIRGAAVAAVRAGTLPDVKDLIRATLEKTLTKAYTAAYLLATRRQQIEKKRTLKLSALDDIQKSLKRVVNIPLKVQKSIETQAFNVAQGESQKINRMLRGRVADSLNKGKTKAESVKLLKRDFKKLGLSPASDHNLRAIVQTQSQIAYNGASWAATSTDADVWGYKYFTMGDDRVRPSHEELDDATYPKEHPIWNSIFPPNGWNCRCQVETIYVEDEPDDWTEVDPDVDGPDKGFDFNAGRVIFG